MKERLGDHQGGQGGAQRLPATERLGTNFKAGKKEEFTKKTYLGVKMCFLDVKDLILLFNRMICFCRRQRKARISSQAGAGKEKDPGLNLFL